MASVRKVIHQAFFSDLRFSFVQLPTVLDSNCSPGGTTVCASSLHSIKHIHTFDNLAKHDVTAIKMRCWGESQEELRAVGAWARVCHRQSASISVLHIEVLVIELGSIDRLTSDSSTVSEVTALGHEAGDDTVELGALEV